MLTHTDSSSLGATALRVHNLTVRYAGHLYDRPALEEVSLKLAAGTVTGLIGVNGAGKSTLFDAIMGLRHGDTGTVELHRPVAYVPQHHHVDWNFPISVAEVVGSGTTNPHNAWEWGVWGWRRPKNKKRIAAALERTNLADLRRRPIAELSGGQKKRVFVARGIAQGARVMLLDEPFAGVDEASRAEIVALLHELAAEGVAVLVSTHDLTHLPQLCERAVLLNRRVVADGPVAEVLAPEVLAEGFAGGSPRGFAGDGGYACV